MYRMALKLLEKFGQDRHRHPDEPFDNFGA